MDAKGQTMGLRPRWQRPVCVIHGESEAKTECQPAKTRERRSAPRCGVLTLLAEWKLPEPVKDDRHGRRLMEEQDTLGGIVAGQFGEVLSTRREKVILREADSRGNGSIGPMLGH